MARGLDNYNKRQDELKSFGRDLARRSQSKCELCGAAGVHLEIFEVPPVKPEPDFDKCLFMCGTCAQALSSVKKRSTDHWRCLTERIWSDIPAVKIISVMILREISGREPWAAGLLEDLYLDEDEEKWASAGLG